MKDLLTVVLATAWVLGVIRYMGTRRHPRETSDHIDRDFREMVERAHHKTTAGVQGSVSWSTPCDMAVGECDICEVIPNGKSPD